MATNSPPQSSPQSEDARWLRPAFALALGAAVSLGLARFSYALLLPPMRAELGWSYFTAGAMNMANAAGYLAGALTMPRALAAWPARRVLLGGVWLTCVVLLGHAAARDAGMLYALRTLAGVASAATFVAGGLMAARLGQTPGAKPSLVLGLYYGGTGLGIVASSWVVPALPWPRAWVALALLSLLAGAVLAAGTRRAFASAGPVLAGPRGGGFEYGHFGFALAGYLMFGLGYIGYMTFIITLLREQGAGTATVVAFYSLLGLGVVASSWLWAPLLQRSRGGQALALLNALLALATLLPVFSAAAVVAFASGLLFGAVFLSVVASTTALVRHNLPPAAWPAGISAFTVVFAAGQIVGPGLVGALADGAGGLRSGLAASGAMLALGALLAWRQRPLATAPHASSVTQVQ